MIKEMVLELIVKKEALDKSQDDPLRARNATSHTFSFDEITRMLFHFYYTMLLARRERNMRLATIWIDSVIAPRTVNL